MAGRTSSERRALEAMASRLTGTFEAAGFDYIAPDILQPADVFLDRSGEDIRSRTFVFTDQNGVEQCLRPDLTVPACRFHLSHADDPAAPANYCYSGPAFRYQPGEVPFEFHQVGIESFGAEDAEAAETHILATALSALDAAGLRECKVQIGDLGLFHALLDSLPMPERWRRRLKHHFWRPRAFRALLQVLTGAARRPRTSISPLVDQLPDGDLDRAGQLVTSELDARGLSLFGGRSLAEIAERLADKAADRIETPLGAGDSAYIDTYLAIRGSPAEATTAVCDLAAEVGGSLKAAADRLQRRMRLFEDGGIDTGSLEFSAVFGRSLEYYTGFVFQIEVPSAARPITVAGGGRYDTMLSDIGAGKTVPAVGCAIYTERLLALAGGEA